MSNKGLLSNLPNKGNFILVVDKNEIEQSYFYPCTKAGHLLDWRGDVFVKESGYFYNDRPILVSVNSANYSQQNLVGLTSYRLDDLRHKSNDRFITGLLRFSFWYRGEVFAIAPKVTSYSKGTEVITTKLDRVATPLHPGKQSKYQNSIIISDPRKETVAFILEALQESIAFYKAHAKAANLGDSLLRETLCENC